MVSSTLVLRLGWFWLCGSDGCGFGCGFRGSVSRFDRDVPVPLGREIDFFGVRRNLYRAGWSAAGECIDDCEFGFARRTAGQQATLFAAASVRLQLDRRCFIRRGIDIRFF